MDNKAIPFPMEGEKIFEFNLTPEPTILAKLDEFITLSHVRHFAAAETLFDESLKAHLDKALVVEIEYADHLLQQGNYAHLSKFLDERISLRLERGIRSEKQAGSLSLDPVLEEELHLFGVIKALSDLLGVGALRQALAQAQRCKELLARATRERFPSNIQVCLELCCGSRPRLTYHSSDLYVRDVSRDCRVWTTSVKLGHHPGSGSSVGSAS